GLTIFPLEVHPDTKDYETALQLGVIEPGLAPYLKLKRYPLYHSRDVSKQLMLDLDSCFKEVSKAMREIREEVNRLGTEPSRILPRISEITAIHNATMDDLLLITDRYARWFQKKVRNAVVNLWRRDVISFQLSELDEIVDEMNLLETELQKTREQPYERHPGDYDMGNLERTMVYFLNTFSEFVNALELTE
ncbi:MAG: hypothetical protein ACFFER_15885, partial [Candidatus Thorarchaeota archaeon]